MSVFMGDPRLLLVYSRSKYQSQLSLNIGSLFGVNEKG